MKKKCVRFLSIIFASMIAGQVFGQATSLVVDNQTPGWLSSKIAYGDQLTVEDLTVTGYLNDADLTLIATLMKSRALKKRLDLGNARIVSSTGDADDIIPPTIWGNTQRNGSKDRPFKLQYFRLPYNVLNKNIYALTYLEVDTLCQTGGAVYGFDAKVRHYFTNSDATSFSSGCFNGFADTLETVNVNFEKVKYFKEKISGRSSTYLGENMKVRSMKNWNNFPMLERFSVGFGYVGESPDSVFFPNIRVLTLNHYFSYRENTFFKKGMHIFIGEKIDTLTDISKAQGIYLHFSKKVPPVIEAGWVYHSQPENDASYILYVPKGCSDAYRACFKNGGTKVTIYENPEPVTGITIDSHEALMDVGENIQLNATITPSNADDMTYRWMSNDETIATVDSNGKVTARQSGKTTIYAISNDGGFTDSCVVNVKFHVVSLTLNESNLYFSGLGKTQTLLATVEPEQAYDKTIRWSSSNSSVCTVSQRGEVTSVGYGNAVVTAMAVDGGYIANCLVTVYEPVTLTAQSYTREYGEPNPSFEYVSVGGTVTGTPLITCEATPTSPVGTYPIIISKGSVTNLGDTYVNGTLTITPASLTVNAGNYVKRQGEDNPAFTPVYTGFKNNETVDVLTKMPILKTDVTKSTSPGDYPVYVSGAEAQNYSISYVTGTLKVLEADAIILKAVDFTINYGDNIPALTYTVEGAELKGEPQLHCDATSTSPVGIYPIIIEKGAVENYNDTYINGTLTIEKAPLNVSVGNYVRKEGEDNPKFELTYDGFKNNESVNVLNVVPKATTTATMDSPAGEYPITISGGEAQNYAFEYINGTLTITAVSGIDYLTLFDGQPFDVYTLQGIKVRNATVTLEGLQPGVYIINGRKVIVK